MLYAEIAVAVPVDHLYTYRVPEDLETEVAIGKRIVAPFRNKYMTGYVVQLTDATTVEAPKDLVDVLDPEPVVTPAILRLTKWIADYYLCSWGLAIKAALPAGIDVTHETTITFLAPDSSEIFQEKVESPVTHRGLQKKFLVYLRQNPSSNLRDLEKKLGRKSLNASLHALQKQGVIQIEHTAKTGKVKPKTLQHLTLLRSPDAMSAELPQIEAQAPQQAAILRVMLSHFPDDLSVTQLREQVAFDPRSAVKALEHKQFIRLTVKQVHRKPLAHLQVQPTTPLALTSQQQQVLDHVMRCLDAGQFAPLLLHGITGSGKTEIYLQAIAYLKTLGRTALVMVPEISLTPLLVSRFLSRFGEHIAVLHSKLSSGERLDEWQRIRSGEVDVVIGARSAIFAPLERLGLIVVDEEHEMSYKQDTVPRYHGRDTAVMRAQFEAIPILLGSATPSLESYYNAQTGKYHLLNIPERIDHRPLPGVEIVDMRKERGPGASLFSNRLEEAMRDVLAKKEQVLLFLNLRGFANFYLCQECGFVYECPRCSVTLTYHAYSNRLLCHYCDFSRLPPTLCEQCHNPTVHYRGIGTEQVEQTVQVLFPEAAVARMDKDTVSGKHGHYNILRRVEQHEIDILIGTQMVTKGHDFPDVTLVGVIAAETALHLPDFRASERTFQMLTQVAGRTGRGHLGGEVIIQTYAPSHYAIRTAQMHDYETFYAREISYREHLTYPPFARVINLMVQGGDEEFTWQMARELAQYLRAARHKTLTILGPSPAAIPKLRSKYRSQILLKSPHSQYMRTYVRQQIDAFRATAHLKDVQLIVDVDPVNLL